MSSTGGQNTIEFRVGEHDLYGIRTARPADVGLDPDGAGRAVAADDDTGVDLLDLDMSAMVMGLRGKGQPGGACADRQDVARPPS